MPSVKVPGGERKMQPPVRRHEHTGVLIGERRPLLQPMAGMVRGWR